MTSPLSGKGIQFDRVLYGPTPGRGGRHGSSEFGRDRLWLLPLLPPQCRDGGLDDEVPRRLIG